MPNWPSIAGWYCPECEVAWHLDAEPVCWSCGCTTTTRSAMPYPSLGATVEEVTTPAAMIAVS